ncbi:MAG: hypothetical protein ACI9QD_000240 [Thermoproteota archaeon]|jgi:hypothetical protein
MYATTQEIFHIILRTHKKDSSFLYFTLEANENISFYSTLEDSLGTAYRDIDIKCSIELKDSLLGILEHLKNKMEFQVLTESVIKDSL